MSVLQRRTNRKRFIQRLLSLMACFAAIAVLVWWEVARVKASTPPATRERADDLLNGHVLAYQVISGIPRLVFTKSEKDRVYFDHLRLAPISIDFPPLPQWQWTGNWTYINYTDAPASLGTARCAGVIVRHCRTTVEIFGQINAREITMLELISGEERRRYPVSYPGYVLQVPDLKDAPNDYRWLDARGHEVWSAQREREADRRSADQPVLRVS